MRKIYLVIVGLLLLASCSKIDDVTTPNNNTTFPTGWNGEDVPSKVPSFLGTFGQASTSSETSVDLSKYLPPIRSQGQWGTCVSWAVTHGKTIIEAVGKNLTQADLQNDANRISPRDLWEGLDAQVKGSNCHGTQIFYALDALQRRGALTWNNSPYESISCSISGKPGTSESLKHKIKYYRKIEQSVAAIKASLRNKIPIVMAGMINGNQWQSGYGGQIMADKSWIGTDGHALLIVGFDDAKNAFKIANSWDATWGISGYCWIDYNFLVNQLVTTGNLYIMGDESVSKVNTDFGVDLTPYVFSDESDFKASGIVNQRLLEFNLYNIGSKTADPSNSWEFYYIYYNAYNANDYGVIFKDKFNTTVKANSYSCSSSTDCSFNYSITGGNDFAYQVFQQSTVKRTYKVPTTLTGTYYLVLYADATSKIDEQNEQNNLFYTTGQNPLVFAKGVAARQSAEGMELFTFSNKKKPTITHLKSNEFQTAINKDNLNAYSPDEIINFLKEKKKTGELDKKIIEGDLVNPYAKN